MEGRVEGSREEKRLGESELSDEKNGGEYGEIMEGKEQRRGKEKGAKRRGWKIWRFMEGSRGEKRGEGGKIWLCRR